MKYCIYIFRIHFLMLILKSITASSSMILEDYHSYSLLCTIIYSS
nr:MAG TPA: hypothetical protein [Caudoviricetes sp.]